jgi:DNA-binding LacI/PurR family transcriptional regulator
MAKKTNLTTEDIAIAAGVSRYTVSRVLNNRGGVTQKTIDLIRGTIRELGYTPSADKSRRGPKPKSENPERSNLVLFAGFGLKDSGFQGGFYQKMSLAVEYALAEKGFGMITQCFPPGMSLPLNLSCVDGAIFLGEPPLEVREQTKPVVQVLGETSGQEFWDHISYNGYQIGVLAAEYLMGRNHTALALLAGGAAQRRRQDGFINTVRQAGLEPLVLDGNQSLYYLSNETVAIDPDELGRRLDRLLKARPRPTGLFVDADMITVALYSLLYSRGMIPGRDIDIVSCNYEQSLLSPLIPPPPSVDLNVNWIGRTAVERLLCRMKNPMDPFANMICQPVLKV